MQQEVPEGATHVRDKDQFYKVTNKVQYFEYGVWNDAVDCFDFSGWLDEIKEIQKS